MLLLMLQLQPLQHDQLLLLIVWLGKALMRHFMGVRTTKVRRRRQKLSRDWVPRWRAHKDGDLAVVGHWGIGGREHKAGRKRLAGVLETKQGAQVRHVRVQAGAHVPGVRGGHGAHKLEG